MGAKAWVNLVKGRHPQTGDPHSTSSEKEGWYWVDQGPAGAEKAALKNVHKACGLAVGQRMVKGPGQKSEDDWLQISNEELSSEDDLSDLEDTDLVSLAPRNRLMVHEPPVIPSMSQMDDLVSEEVNIMRKRPGTKSANPHQPQSSPQPLELPEHAPATCWDITFDSNVDLVWTFVAGMCLYLLSV